jgi:hypothetical protein
MWPDYILIARFLETTWWLFMIMVGVIASAYFLQKIMDKIL